MFRCNCYSDILIMICTSLCILINSSGELAHGGSFTLSTDSPRSLVPNSNYIDKNIH